jgi:heme/copper-type cytochrome/quinol oxidase subunit 4
MGFYGQDATLFDSAGPYSRMGATTSNTTKFVVVDPAFVAAYTQRIASGEAVVYAYVEAVPGPFNEFASSIGFQVLKGAVMILLVLAFLYGVWQYVGPMLMYAWQRFIRRGVVRVEWISPFSARFWRPYQSTAMRLISLFSLVAWLLAWRYKTLSGGAGSFYYLSLLCTIIGFCMMVNRWCGFARKVRDYRVYRLLGYWAYVEIPLAIIAGVFSIVRSFTKNTTIQQALFLTSNYILNPSLCLMAFAFFLTALHFLRKMKRLALQQDALHSLRKMTFVSIVGFILVVAITVAPIVYATHAIQSNAGYLFILLYLTIFWLLYHTLVFYLLSIRLTQSESVHNPAAVSLEDDAHSAQTKSTERIGLSSIGATEHESPSTVWNAVVLQGLVPTDKKQFHLPGTSNPSDSVHGMTTSLLSLREFNSVSSPTTLTPSSIPAEMAHYFQKDPAA